LRIKCKEFSEFYHEDINHHDLKSTFFSFKAVLKKSSKSIRGLEYIGLKYSNKGREIEKKIFECGNCYKDIPLPSDHHFQQKAFFFTVKKYKNKLRTTMLKERLTNCQ
jgi:hypothetical protein